MQLDRKDKIFIGAGLVLALLWYDVHRREQEREQQMYGRGRGVQQNYDEAVKWYRQAVDQHYALAQFNPGFFYQNGWGVTKDEAEAVRWYSKAAELGHAGA